MERDGPGEPARGASGREVDRGDERFVAGSRRLLGTQERSHVDRLGGEVFGTHRLSSGRIE
ncbi:hypothetical protein GCM10017712_11840 [Curtobacterium citreum]